MKGEKGGLIETLHTTDIYQRNSNQFLIKPHIIDDDFRLVCTIFMSSAKFISIVMTHDNYFLGIVREVHRIDFIHLVQ